MKLFSITRSFRIRPAKNKRVSNQYLTQARPDKKFGNCRRWVRVGFALVLSPAQVVTISPVMAFGVLILLISWTRRYMRAAKERRLHAELQ
jgi:hypothetical protein